MLRYQRKATQKVMTRANPPHQRGSPARYQYKGNGETSKGWDNSNHINKEMINNI